MRPRLLTLRNFVLLLCVAVLLGGLSYWVKLGMPLPGGRVPSTAGKIAFVTETGNKTSIGMMKADGTESVILTGNGGTISDRSPAWSASGNDIAFVSENRAGVNPQVFEMYAIAGGSVGQMTHSDSPKDSPLYGPDGRIYYLDAGKVAVTSADGTDTDALLPDHEQRVRPPEGHADIFAAGGFRQVLVFSDREHLATVMHTERGDALLLYDMDENSKALFLLGIANHIHITMSDIGLTAVFQGSQPFEQPLLLFSKATDEAQEEAVKMNQNPPREVIAAKMAQLFLTDPDNITEEMRPKEAKFSVVIFDASGAKTSEPPPPPAGVIPSAVSTSPDGNMQLMTSEQADHGGVFLLDTRNRPDWMQIYSGPAKEGVWSPDSTRIAFTAGNDIYVSPISDSASSPPQPVAITKNGSGGSNKCYSPTWSPAKPPKQ